jgi:hypothetical protein
VSHFHDPTLDYKYLLCNVPNFEQISTFFVVNSLEFKKNFVFGVMRQKLEITDRVNDLLQKEFYMIIIVEDSIFELLNQFWILLHQFFEVLLAQLRKRAIVIGRHCGSAWTPINDGYLSEMVSRIQSSRHAFLSDIADLVLHFYIAVSLCNEEHAVVA